MRKDNELMTTRVLCLSLMLAAIVGTSLAAWRAHAGPRGEAVKQILIGGVP
jgi:hypothetical protein